MYKFISLTPAQGFNLKDKHDLTAKKLYTLFK